MNIFPWKQIMYSRRLGCFALIFYFNCGHCLQTKFRGFYNKKGFSKFSIIEFCYRQSRDFPQKFGLDRFSRFDGYWIQTNRQSDRQAKSFILEIQGASRPSL